ncbi:MAG: purine-cytosine permease family protein [Nocardioidaceae bacterium]
MSSHTPYVGIPELEQKLQPIPEGSRTTNVSGQFWIWCGANIAPINWVLGALGVDLGLGLWDTVAVLVVGNLIGMAAFGFFVLLGQRTGATGVVLSRMPFGRVGSYLPAVIHTLVPMIWCALNTWIVLDLVMALLGKIGLVDPAVQHNGLRIVIAALLMAAQVAITWFGYRAIAAFERWTVPVTIAILVAMSIAAWFFLDIDWGYSGPSGHVLTGSAKWAAMTGVMTAIGIGWGITWFIYACDYSRFVSTKVPARKLYLASTLGQFIPVVWLGLLGATLATKSVTVDPGKLVVDNFGAFAIPVLLLVIHGPIATNILNIYTCTVSTQALDLNLPRRAFSVVVGVVSMVVVVFFIYRSDLAGTLDSVLSGIVAWVATWGGIMIVHYYWLMRGREVPVSKLFAPVSSRALPGVNWAGIVAFVGGIVMTWLFMYGLVPALQGPIAKAMGGVDLSWLAGAVTAGVLYAGLGPIAERKFLDQSARASEPTVEGATA